MYVYDGTDKTRYQPTPAYLWRVIPATLCSSNSMFQSSIRTTFSPLKWPTCSSPWPACTCPGMTPLTQNTYTILPCETLNIHHTCMSFMIMLTWHHDIPLHGTPSFTILLFTYILIPKIAFFKCGSIQNVARVSGSGQVFNLRPGQQSLLHV